MGGIRRRRYAHPESNAFAIGHGHADKNALPNAHAHRNPVAQSIHDAKFLRNAHAKSIVLAKPHARRDANSISDANRRSDADTKRESDAGSARPVERLHSRPSG